MMNHLNNSNNDQDIERPPHFKNVFSPNDVSANADNCLNTNNIVTSESRRPSLVVVPMNNGGHDMRHLALTARSDDLNLDIEMQDGSTESDDASVGGGASTASSACSSSSSSAGGSQTASSSASSVPTASSATATQIMDIPPRSCTDGVLGKPDTLPAASTGNTPLNRTLQNENLNNEHSEKANSNPQLTHQLISNFQFLNLPSNKKPTKKSSSKISKNTTKPIKKYRSKSLPNIHIPSKRSHQILLDIYKQNFKNKNGRSKPGNAVGHNLNNPDMNMNMNMNVGMMNMNMNMNINMGMNMSMNINSNGTNNFMNIHHQQQLFLQHQQQQQMLLLPPVNLHSMHEIDLQEVLKNPQLRHDILFDPQLQFRPNLDGERGKRKKVQSENYWNMIKFETERLLKSSHPKAIDHNSPIIIMFQCLKSILVSLIPSKDISSIEEILDISLLIQELNSKCFNFLGFFDWICSIFKLHCAPMRDTWVDELGTLFHKACESEDEVNIDYLIEGLKTLFLILEAMKLDVANHQIRILRPLLCSSAVSFEKEYFKNAIKRNKINFTSSMLWFKKNSIELDSKNPRDVLNYSVLNLLSCSTMYHQFPNTLNFDHTRLLLLRADLRHIICTKLCSILYKTLIYQNNLDKSLLNDANMLSFKKEILNIIVDENGNSKWTKNLKNLSVQLINNLFGNLDSDKIDFAYNWLLKQTQPNSKVYSLLESKLFEKILPFLSAPFAINNNTNTNNNIDSISTSMATNINSSNSNSTSSKIEDDIIVNDELRNVTDRLNQLIEFNYNVFSDMYTSYLN